TGKIHSILSTGGGIFMGVYMGKVSPIVSSKQLKNSHDLLASVIYPGQAGMWRWLIFRRYGAYIPV
ncbi:MAG: hypothetical protein DRZ80_08055, partial [Thermoprotei archaeon]